MQYDYKSDYKAIGNSLVETIAQIEKNGETPLLKFEMLFKFAKMKFLDNKADEAHKIFGKCNSVLIDNGLPENFELYYWMARIFEGKGEIEKAASTYRMCLTRGNLADDPEFINELLDRINNIEPDSVKF